MMSAIISVGVSLLMSPFSNNSLSNSYRCVMSHLINLYSSPCMREVTVRDDGPFLETTSE